MEYEITTTKWKWRFAGIRVIKSWIGKFECWVWYKRYSDGKIALLKYSRWRVSRRGWHVSFDGSKILKGKYFFDHNNRRDIEYEKSKRNNAKGKVSVEAQNA